MAGRTTRAGPREKGQLKMSPDKTRVLRAILVELRAIRVGVDRQIAAVQRVLRTTSLQTKPAAAKSRTAAKTTAKSEYKTNVAKNPMATRGRGGRST